MFYFYFPEGFRVSVLSYSLIVPGMIKTHPRGQYKLCTNPVLARLGGLVVRATGKRGGLSKVVTWGLAPSCFSHLPALLWPNNEISCVTALKKSITNQFHQWVSRRYITQKKWPQLADWVWGGQHGPVSLTRWTRGIHPDCYPGQWCSWSFYFSVSTRKELFQATVNGK